MRLAGALLLAAALPAAAGDPLRVLVVSGAGEEERAGAALLADALRRAGRFAVWMADDPGLLAPATLARYDAVAADCACPPWSAAARRAVERFARAGKGLVMIGGDCASPPPGAGHRALRVRWGGAEYLTVDQPAWGPAPPAGAAVVAVARPDGAGEERPVAWRAALGKGRLFQTSLGRNLAVRGEPEFLRGFLEGVEWAATGGTAPPAPARETAARARALVVTGGHPYDPSFYTLFEDQPGITATVDPHPLPYRRGDLRKSYDVLVLYDSMQTIDEVERKNLMNFVESGKGVVILHHALVDYSDMPWWWEEVMGARWLKVGGPGTRWKTTWKHDVELLVYPVGEHPVTAGVGPMRIWDETYKGMWLAPDIQVLMRTDHPTSDGPVVWISPYKKSRVVVIELGHDRKAHRHPGYRKLVRNAILWSAAVE